MALVFVQATQSLRNARTVSSCLRPTSPATCVSLNARLMSSHHRTPLLLSPSQLKDASSYGDVVVLDASWHMPTSPRVAYDEFLAKRIPGARYLDLDKVASPNEMGLKHMMPSREVFARACESFGISPSSHVVIYDTHGVFSSPRALFMFKSFGHDKSSILDGGLPRWEDEKMSVEDGEPSQAKATHYAPPARDPDVVRSYEQIVSNSFKNPETDPSAVVVLDARSNARFLGTVPEPRAGLSSGHIPNSFSLPFDMFLKTVHTDAGGKYTMFRPPAEIGKALVDAVGVVQADLIVSGKRPVTTTCGSGMTAGVIWLGLRLLGVDNVGLYDESWTGYAMRESSRIAKSL